MKLTKKTVSIILAVLTAILLIGSVFFGGVLTEQALSHNRINHSTYCESGAIVQKIDNEYLLRLDNGKYSLIECKEAYADNTKVIVCFEMNETDTTDDDRIIAISTDLYGLSESLFTEEVTPTEG